MIYKRAVLPTLIFFILLCLLAAIQTGVAIHFSKSSVKLEPADLIVVFPGESQRIEKGIDVVKKGLAPRFMVINTSYGDLNKLLKNNGVSEAVNALSGGKSRSTFEDVYQTVKTIKESHLRSVIVVTSSYHLPRVLFLLGVYLNTSGQNVYIQGFPVKLEQKPNIKLQQYLNEIIKFWGSLVEMTGYYLTGDFVLDQSISKKLQKVFKKNFLLQAHHEFSYI